MRKLSPLVLLTFVGALTAASRPEVRFFGNDSLTSPEILAHLVERDVELGKSTQPSQGELRRAGRLIRQFYQDQGYPLAEVEYESAKSGSRFLIREGPEARLGWIEIEGNHVLTDQQLTKLLALDGKLNFDDLEFGLDRIRKKYRDAGYFGIDVQRREISVVEVDGRSYFPLPFQKVGKNRIRLELLVTEGPRFKLGTIGLPRELAEAEIEPPAEGEIYSEIRLLQFRERVGEYFGEAGRLIKEFQILQRPDTNNAKVDLEIRFSLYPPLEVRRIRFTGNNSFSESFYRRELSFDEGEILDPREITKSIKALNSTGLLKSPLTEQDVEVVFGGLSDEVDVLFELDEKKRQNIFYTLARTDLGGIEANVVYTVAGLIGLGETLGVEVNYGGGTSGLALSLASRYLLGTDIPVTMALRFFRRQTGLKLSDVDDKVKEIFSSRSTGFSGLVEYRISDARRTGIRYTAEQLTSPVSSSHLALTPFFSETRRDPGSGVRHIEVSNRFSFFGDSLTSWNWRPSLDYLRSSSVEPGSRRFSFRLQASHAHFSDGPTILSERLFLDADSIRGFPGTTTGPWGHDEEGEFRPVGGDTLVSVNSEYEIPLSKTFTLAPFVDGGINLSLNSTSQVRLAARTNRVLRTSIGSELRIRLPQPFPQTRLIAAWNPLRLDQLITTPDGIARLRDPRTMFRVAIKPIF